MTDHAIIGPVFMRSFNLEGPCSANIGHRHNYDHVTVLQYGAVDSQVLDDEGDDVVEVYSLRLPPIVRASDGVFLCGGLWLQRVNVFPDGPLAIPIERQSVLLVQQGRCRVGHGSDDRLCMPGGTETLTPGESLKLIADMPSQLLIVKPMLPSDHDRSPAPAVAGSDEFCLIEATKRHRMKSVSPMTRYSCVYPHRNFDGLTVETYEEALGNQQAYA